MSGINLKSYIGAFRQWVGQGATRHEVSLVSVWHPALIVGKGHLASIRIDVARALVALAEQSSADKVLSTLSDSIRAAEAERKRINADGTGRKRTESGTDSRAESPFERDAEPATKPAPRKTKPVTLRSTAPLSADKGGPSVTA